MTHHRPIQWSISDEVQCGFENAFGDAIETNGNDLEQARSMLDFLKSRGIAMVKVSDLEQARDDADTALAAIAGVLK